MIRVGAVLSRAVTILLAQGQWMGSMVFRFLAGVLLTYSEVVGRVNRATIVFCVGNWILVWWCGWDLVCFVALVWCVDRCC